MALNSLYCADVPLSNYSLTHCIAALFINYLGCSDGETHWLCNNVKFCACQMPLNSCIAIEHNDATVTVTNVNGHCPGKPGLASYNNNNNNNNNHDDIYSAVIMTRSL